MSDDDDIEINDRIARVSEGAVLKVKAKRGNGTRDQDTIVGKVKGQSVSDLEDEREELTETIKRTANDVREIQPGEEDDE